MSSCNAHVLALKVAYSGVNFAVIVKTRPPFHLIHSKIYTQRLAFKKSLEQSHGVLQLLKTNFNSVLLLHLLKPLFSVFHALPTLSIFLF